MGLGLAPPGALLLLPHRTENTVRVAYRLEGWRGSQRNRTAREGKNLFQSPQNKLEEAAQDPWNKQLPCNADNPRPKGFRSLLGHDSCKADLCTREVASSFPETPLPRHVCPYVSTMRFLTDVWKGSCPAGAQRPPPKLAG